MTDGLIIIFLGLIFPDRVWAGCPSGYYCAGTTVVQFASGCERRKYPSGTYYCKQLWEAWPYHEITCDSDCFYYLAGNWGVCRSSTPIGGQCPVTWLNHSGSCCAQMTTYCGDRSCNGSENCGSCPSDCGACLYAQLQSGVRAGGWVRGNVRDRRRGDTGNAGVKPARRRGSERHGRRTSDSFLEQRGQGGFVWIGIVPGWL